MKICYREINFRPDSLALIEQVNGIIDEYQRMGYSLTLRQVYYQLVARDIIPNNERSYKNLGNLINDARLAGLISWEAIVDRTRYIRKNSHWAGPSEIVWAAANQLFYDRWADQDYYVEVWVEKDALVDVVGKTCEELDVPYFSCRGYVSQSEMWTAAQRLRDKADDGKEIVVLHLGDHDPSGIDMSRDIEERLNLFEAYPTFRRIALNMDQIEEYSPPPNPAKLSDSRARDYISRHGYESWELDALRPEVIDELIREHVYEFRDPNLLDEIVEREERDKELLKNVARNWRDVETKYRAED